MLDISNYAIRPSVYPGLFGSSLLSCSRGKIAALVREGSSQCTPCCLSFTHIPGGVGLSFSLELRWDALGPLRIFSCPPSVCVVFMRTSRLLFYVDQRALNIHLARAQSLSELHSVLAATQPLQMNLINVTTALHRSAKFAPCVRVRGDAEGSTSEASSHPAPPGSLVREKLPFLPSLIQRLHYCLKTPATSRPSAPGFSNLLWALGRLHRAGGIAPQEQVATLLLEQLPELLPTFLPQHVANSTWGLVQLLRQADGVRGWDGPAVPAMFDQFVGHIPHMKLDGLRAQHVASLLWSLAAARAGGDYPDGRLPDGALSRADRAAVDYLEGLCKRVAADMRPQEVANVAWALARLEGNTGIIVTLTDMYFGSGRATGDWSSQELSSLLWALARAGVEVDALRAGTLDRILGAFKTADPPSSQSVANALWALAVFQYRPFQLELPLEALADPRHVANAFWAMAALDFLPPAPFVSKVLDSAFTEQQASNCLWAFAALNMCPPERSLRRLAAMALGPGAGLWHYRQLFAAHVHLRSACGIVLLQGASLERAVSAFVSSQEEVDRAGSLHREVLETLRRARMACRSEVLTGMGFGVDIFMV